MGRRVIPWSRTTGSSSEAGGGGRRGSASRPGIPRRGGASARSPSRPRRSSTRPRRPRRTRSRGGWRKPPAPRRGELLLEAARIFRSKKEDLARTVTGEMGKILAEGRGDVQEVIDFLEHAAGEGRRMFGETVPSELPNKMCLTVRLPVGPVGLITPWNFPMAIPGWKSGAALVAGCSFVLKPSSLTPLCAAKFVEVLDEAGFPTGVVNRLTG